MIRKTDRRKLAAILTIATLAFMTGCGSSSQPAPPPPGAAPGPAQPGGAYGSGSCVPLNTTSVIGFTANSMYFGTYGAAQVKAGIIPFQQPYGQVILTGPGFQPAPVNPGYGSAIYTGNRVDGTTITLNVTAGAPQIPGQPYGQVGNVNATGFVQISPLVQQVLFQIAGGGTYATPGSYFSYPGQYPGYPPQYPQGYPPGTYPPGGSPGQVCLSGLAIDMQHTLYSNQLYLGTLYFYLNGTPHGLALDF